jgi:TolA-binding protein
MNKGILISISTLLAVALIALGVFFGMGVGELNKANTKVTALEADITSLQDQLTTETIIANSLQTQLSVANGNIAKLQTNLDTANAKITSLQTDLDTANAKVASTQASLDKANADLAVAKTSNTSLTASLTKVENPRHFNSVQELTDWLAKDDTNTNPAYSSLSTAAKAYVLQVKALRSGYLLPAFLVLDSTGTYILAANLAVVGANIYLVDPSSDATSPYLSFATALPLQPLIPS